MHIVIDIYVVCVSEQNLLTKTISKSWLIQKYVIIKQSY